jgi:hypothetical protein
MSLEEEIAKAIRSHEQWKVELSALIERGSVSVDAADIGKDNICAFGQWLYGVTIPKDARYDPHYIIVRFIHANFHQCAGIVVQLLSAGKTAEATALMESNGEYTRISDQLMAAMMNWKESVHKTRAEKHLRRVKPI